MLFCWFDENISFDEWWRIGRHWKLSRHLSQHQWR
jgi:hypothetical protein